MSMKWFTSILPCVFMAYPINAEETVLFCNEQHILSFVYEVDEWRPDYANQSDGRRYAIRFNDDESQITGVQGGDTIYQCGRYFPTKASDVISCTNTLVATMVFNYSTESGRFLFNFVGPGGWLAVETKREEEYEELLFDHLIMGTCQEF
jgi:hypothetical protein